MIATNVTFWEAVFLAIKRISEKWNIQPQDA